VDNDIVVYPEGLGVLRLVGTLGGGCRGDEEVKGLSEDECRVKQKNKGQSAD
jgi:hypothetical protein